MAGGPSAEAESCVFCGIVAHRTPAHILLEDESTVAFLDLFPWSRGHLLVVPKVHKARLTDLSFDLQTALLRTLGEMCRRTERLTPNYNLGLNAGRPAGQVVPHVHFHIIPRYGEIDPFRSGAREPLSDADARALLRELGPS